MVQARSDIDYVEELLQLRDVYVNVHPQARLGVIRKRLAANEIGPAKLITVVSAVEALARSLMLHRACSRDESPASVYPRFKPKEADQLVEQFLATANIQDPARHFAEDTWQLFRYAVNYRNLLVHECTYLGQDKYPSLIAACDEVLDSLVHLGGLE